MFPAIVKLAPLIIIIALVGSVAFMSEHIQRKNAELSALKTQHKLEMQELDNRYQEEAIEYYEMAGEIIKDQQEKIRDIKQQMDKEEASQNAIVDKAKENDDEESAWDGIDELFNSSVSTKD